ncbi:MAG: PIN domain-containing protein [Verrucomicrobiota bacterium]
MSRTNHIFIDYENRKEADFSRAAGKPVRIYLIIGPQDTKLPTSVSLFLQAHPGQLTIIQSPRAGHNAADLVLARELGKAAAEDSTGCFHIISKDADYDLLVQYLLGQKRSVARYDSLEKVPVLGCLPKDHFAKLCAQLRDSKGNRPKNRTKLESLIQSHYNNTLSPEELQEIVCNLSAEDVVRFSNEGKSIYPSVVTKFPRVA